MVIKWSKVENPGLQNYLLERWTGGNAGTQLVKTQIFVDKNTTQYTDTLLVSPYVSYSVWAMVTGAKQTLISDTQTFVRNDI